MGHVMYIVALLFRYFDLAKTEKNNSNLEFDFKE